MLSKHRRCHGLGMDALVTICSKHERHYALGMDALALETRRLLWFGHGCTGNRMMSKHGRCHGLGMDALVPVCSRNTKHGCICNLMLSEPSGKAENHEQALKQH